MLMPQGSYQAILRGAVMDTANTGNPQMVVKFDVNYFFDPSTQAWRETPANTVRSLYMSFSQAALPFSQKKLESLGFNGDFKSPEFAMTNQPVDLTMAHSVYKGQQKEKWELASFGGEKDVVKPGDQTLDRLNAMWDQAHPKIATPAAQGVPMQNAPTNTTPPAGLPPVAVADDVPF